MQRPLLVAALAASCLVAPAAAQTARHSVTVRHDDLDLSSREGQARLDRRIGRVAREACGRPSPMDLPGSNARPGCVRDAVVSAQRQRVLLRRQAAQASAVH
jgi:UrcA family protein